MTTNYHVPNFLLVENGPFKYCLTRNKLFVENEMCFLASLEISKNDRKFTNLIVSFFRLLLVHKNNSFLQRTYVHKSSLQLKFRKLYAANHKPYLLFTAMWVDLNYSHNMVNHCFMNLIKVICKKRNFSFQLERTFEIENLHMQIEFDTAKIELIYT